MVFDNVHQSATVSSEMVFDSAPAPGSGGARPAPARQRLRLLSRRARLLPRPAAVPTRRVPHFVLIGHAASLTPYRAAHLSRRLEGESPLVKRSVVPYHLPLPLCPLVRPPAACVARAACAADAACAVRRRPCSRLFDMHCLRRDRRRCWRDRSLRWRGRCRYRRRCCRQWRRYCRQWRRCLSHYMGWGRWSDCEPPLPCPT